MMSDIPDEFRDLPEAVRLRHAQAKFAIAAENARDLGSEDQKVIRRKGEQLRAAQNELRQAQQAFDRATGEPKPIGLTEAVVVEIAKHFRSEQIEQVKSFLQTECGRTIPFFREATPEQLEHIQIGVLRLSEGKFSELRKWVGLANIDHRDVILAASLRAKDE